MDLEEELFINGLISEESHLRLKSRKTGLFSIGFELKALLYCGVLLVASGLGIAIYKNIDTIGHMAIIAAIATISFGSFYYCIRKTSPYTHQKVESPNIFFDYVLLLAGLTFVSFVGYLQFQYSVFGSFNGIAFLVPALILFFAAYYFDHLGILSMAITSFAAFLGISVSPISMLDHPGYSFQPLIYTGIILGVLLIVTARILSQNEIKDHFSFTYHNFGAHLLFIFALSGLFNQNVFLFTLIVASITFFCVMYALQTRSFYFMLIGVLYGYVAVSYILIRIMMFLDADVGGIYVFFFYLIFSAIFVIRFLRDYRNKLRNDASL